MRIKKKLFISLALIAILSACAAPVVESEIQLPTLESSESVVDFVELLSAETNKDELYTLLYEEVNPGVVAINVYSEEIGSSQGSGFLFDREGHILTNYHVLESADGIEVVFSTGYRTLGTLIGTDLDSDIAVIQVDVPDEEIQPLALGSSANVKVGQTVIAIGNPYGLSGTMTVGIVSARGRLLESMREAAVGSNFSSADLIQTDAAINPGNSGGPLLNLNGEVIGINRAIRTNGEDGVLTLSNSGIGFAVPIDIVKRVTPYLIEEGVYAYPYLGIVSREELNLAEREELDLPVEIQGAYVMSVADNGPAESAGIRGGNVETSYAYLPAGGDLIIAINGNNIRSFSELLSYLVTNNSPGDSVNVTILRDGEELTLPVVLTSRPD